MLAIPPSAIQYTTDLFHQHDLTNSTVSSTKNSNQIKLVQRKTNWFGERTKLIFINDLELLLLPFLKLSK